MFSIKFDATFEKGVVLNCPELLKHEEDTLTAELSSLCLTPTFHKRYPILTRTLEVSQTNGLFFYFFIIIYVNNK